MAAVLAVPLEAIPSWDRTFDDAADEGAGDGASYGRVKAALRRAVDGHQGRPEEGERARHCVRDGLLVPLKLR